MTLHVVASAPGKVVLSGEYVVLDDAPAVAMAVNRRAVVTVSSAENDTQRFEADPDSLVGTLLAALGDDSVNDCVCDTAAFNEVSSGPKYGLGSSAALTVALCAALRRDTAVLPKAMQLHRDWQGGAGSGVDIACSTAGGLVEYRMSSLQIESLSWPAGLEYRLIWTGAASDTRRKLKSWAELGRISSRQRLAQAAENAAAAWRSGDSVALLDVMDDYGRRLRELDVEAQLGIYAAGHAELADAATAADLTYKPCGAGGGDIGILLAASDAALEAFVAKNALHSVPCELDLRGVALENSGNG